MFVTAGFRYSELLRYIINLRDFLFVTADIRRCVGWDVIRESGTIRCWWLNAVGFDTAAFLEKEVRANTKNRVEPWQASLPDPHASVSFSNSWTCLSVLC